MKKVDLIVTAPHIYTMKGEGVGYEEKKALVVDGSKIIDIVMTLTNSLTSTKRKNSLI